MEYVSSPLKMKSIEEIDTQKYELNENEENPYYKKYGTKNKTQFSMVK